MVIHYSSHGRSDLFLVSDPVPIPTAISIQTDTIQSLGLTKTDKYTITLIFLDSKEHAKDQMSIRPFIKVPHIQLLFTYGSQNAH